MDRTGSFESSDGTSLWYGTVGSGSPVVLCDGLACDGFIWPYLIDRLADDHQVVRWHYSGHGRSENPSDPDDLTVERLAEDLGRLLDALDIARASLAGHSLGVQVILEQADIAPERVDALVAICGSYKYPLDTFHDSDLLRRAVPVLERAVELAPNGVQSIWEFAARSPLAQIIAERAETNARMLRSRDLVPYLEHAAEMDVEVFVALLSSAAEHSAEPYLGDIEAPALIIAGEEDTFTPVYRSREMADAMRDAELVVVPGGTHAAPLEAPARIGDEVERFLAEL
ncbi:MAG: alpha/beta fold hydrolase [Bradymonadaceae bacterium]